MTPEYREKISAAHKGKTTFPPEKRGELAKRMTGPNNPFFGKKHSPEASAKMTAARLREKNHRFGKKHSEETKEKMRLAWELRKKKKIAYEGHVNFDNNLLD